MPTDSSFRSALPPSSPARFISHPRHSDRPSSSPRSDTIDSSFTNQSATTLTIPTNANDITTVDITDSFVKTTSASRDNLSDDDNDLHENDLFSDDIETHKLLDRRHLNLHKSPSTPSLSSAATLVNQPRTSGPHKPVPAILLFARNASPLYLPKLDAYLSTIPKPKFIGDRGTSKNPRMFAPMDRLAASGRSLEDLETNSEVPPFWRNRKTLLGSAVGAVIGITGSSALASFYSLQGVVNTVQVFALILSSIVPVMGKNLGDQWRKLLLGTIPNVLALNFASGLTQSLIFLSVLMVIASGLLFRFLKSARCSDRYNCIEGLQQTESVGKQWGLIAVTFLLTLIYLPISTMAVHVIVWSQDLWVVPNPYENATSFPPQVLPLGPADQFRDPLDFCWTTTMNKNEINYAPALVVLSLIVFIVLTIWFPIALRSVIKKSVPKIDRYTELGRPRNKVDMDAEYHRLLARDQNPFAFLYNGFRREWGTFQSLYLFIKLSTLIIVAVIDPDNCIFRSAPRTVVPIVRQVLLLTSTIIFFIMQCFFVPFLDPVNNANEWTSRLNYVSTSAVALLVTLKVPGKEILNTYVLYSIYIITYGLSFYFTVINTGIVRGWVKRLARRIDFSIDVFSPQLAISYPSPHTKRRIWQESITTLFLTNNECKIPDKQTMTFAQARDSEFPPYLLNFVGTPGERHVENLKILREVGSLAYRKAAALLSGPDHDQWRRLEKEIQLHYVGPDSYWKDPTENSPPGCHNFFGNTWLVPFPPSLVMRYDDGRLAVLQDLHQLSSYVSQNASPEIQRKRELRMALRALEGQTVRWPYQSIANIGSQSLWCCCGGGRYNAKSTKHYDTGVLNIKRRGHLMWRGLQLGSGFDVELSYAKGIVLDGDIIGLSDDFDLTVPLARFLRLNQDLVFARLGKIESIFKDYRRHHAEECRHKADVLSYRFLSHVYDQPSDPTKLAESSIKHERDLRVRTLMAGSEAVFEAAYDRLAVVSETETTTWWYIFWDDLWRRNHDTISGLRIHESDFNPYYPTSIAYTPLPRAALESFLIQRGLLSSTPKWGDFFHPGFLNKLYLRLNDTVFRGSSKGILFHIGENKSELDMNGVDLEIQGQPSTLGTGGGTDHDDSSILARPEYRWEGILSDPMEPGKHRPNFLAKLGAWFGVTPLWRAGVPSPGVAVDVRLDNGRYVLLDSD
ncbi:hypothetical protein K435DRAFT_772567 [Dendrothele bispora CBS 962.96]|uniref:Uncharacterized protein n=1 Tax=Dendrothele bispora (strain CBS 962.96) TaxID=1314807 RepID=A0A4S8MWK6_DENBC|nr:hypothetical protein K435DRAFT_772567 [Dendrothele bispora CBS 962.96]